MVKKLIPYILTTLFLFSCKDEYTICDLPTSVRMHCSFYQLNGAVQTKAPVPFLTVTPLAFPSPDYSSPLLSEFSLALNPITDSVQYVISIRDTAIPDTVTFVYTTQLINISALCGDVYINNLTRVSTTTNTLDSVSIFSPAINTTSGENVQIYF